MSEVNLVRLSKVLTLGAMAGVGVELTGADVEALVRNITGMGEEIKTLNARIAELEAERRWIPVSEKPTKSDWYLIMYQGYRVPDAGYYDVEAGWLSDIPTPDCWMPLPEPPEVEE